MSDVLTLNTSEDCHIEIPTPEQCKLIRRVELKALIEAAEETLIDVADIVFDIALYSRKDGIDSAAVDDYSKNIISMPAIVITPCNPDIENAEENKKQELESFLGKYYIVNGVHRYKASQKSEQAQIKAKIIDIEKDNIRFANLLCDLEAGVRHPLQDKKSLCIDLYDAADNSKNQQIYEELSVPYSTWRDWTKDIRKEKQKEVNKAIILDLLNPFLTQEEIAVRNGYENHQTVANLRNNVMLKIANFAKISNGDLIQREGRNGKIEELSIKDDLDRDELDFLLQYHEFIGSGLLLYNIWNTPKGTGDHFGHFPLPFMKNLLYYHTEPFDFVYDPFGGGGTTIDACKQMYRKYHLTDRKPKEHLKDEIKQHDITTGLPAGLPKPDFVFLDPPYWIQAEGEYSDSPKDLGNMSLEDFYQSMKTVFDMLKTNKIKRFALVIQPTQWKNENHAFEDHIFKFHEMVSDKYEIEMRYILPYSSQQYNAQIVTAAKEQNFCLTINRDLVVWRLKDGKTE